MRYPNIEAERARKGFSVEEMTNKLGVSRKTYYNWSKAGHIPANKLTEMADLFNCSVDYLLEEGGEDNAPHDL